MDKKMIISIRLIIFIIVFIVINFGVELDNNFMYIREVTITFNTPYPSENGSIQLFFRTEEQGFNGTDSIREKTVNTNKSQSLTFNLTREDVNGIRIDFDNLDQLNISKLELSWFGINLKTYTAEEIYENNSGYGDIDIRLDVDLILQSTGIDSRLAVTNLDIDSIEQQEDTLINYLLIVWLIIAFLIQYIFGIIIKNMSYSQYLSFIFMIVLCVLPISWWIIGGSSSSELENKSLAEKPDFTLKNITNYSAEFEEYYNDHLAFKSPIVKFNNWIEYHLFDKSPVTNVIKGTEGWLFYSSTLADYQRTNLYDNVRLENIKNRLVEIQQELASQNIEFYIMVGPNKNTIYPEYMPNGYMRYNSESRLEQLFSYIEKTTSIPIINPVQSLLSYKDDYRLYWQLDTHWNTVGSYIGFKELIDSLNISNIPDVKDLDIKIIESQRALDLKNMTGIDLRDNEIYYSFEFSPEVKSDINLLIFGDSFAGGIESYLNKAFNNCEVARELYNYDKVQEIKPDVVVFELVERNISNFAN